MKPKNLLYLHSHDMGRYMGPYGWPTHSPNLQRFAEEGVLFRKAFAAAPTCSPSRAAFLTGCTPHQCGQFGLTNQGWGLHHPEWHLAKYLSGHGFETVTVSNDHVHEPPVGDVTEVWDEFHNHEHMSTFDRWITADAAVSRIEKGFSKPFFMAVGWDVTHRSKWEMVEAHTRETMGPVDDRYASPFPIYADNPETRREAALQARTVAYLDVQVGKVLRALEVAGLAKETMVVFVTDHGPGQPDMKKDLLDFGTGTAFMLRGPGAMTGGKVVDAMVHHCDFYPTVCDAFGLPIPPWVTGKSLVPLLEGRVAVVHEAVFAEHNYHGSATPLRSVRTERYKYIRSYSPGLNYGQFGVDAGLIHEQWKRDGRAQIPYPAEQLYDLALDPLERRNLASDPGHADVLGDLRGRLDQWMVDTGDVFPGGNLPKPPRTETYVSYSLKNTRV